MGSFLRTARRGASAALASAILIGAVAAAPDASAADPPAGERAHALENATYYFRANDGSVLALLLLELRHAGTGATPVPDGAGPAYVGAVSVEEKGRRGEDLPGASPRAVPLEIAPGVARAGRAAFFGQVYVESGRNYSVRFVVKDAARDEIFLKNTLLGVPHLNGGFSVSSVVPAEQFGPSGPGIDGLPVGSEEVVPKVGGGFRRSELLRLYLQVYDAKPDPETRVPRVDVVFRFQRSVKGAMKRHGKPFHIRGATGASMGLALPIGDWPEGRYRVVVELHDRVAAALATTEGAFSIVAD